jgi:hypothetical protein
LPLVEDAAVGEVPAWASDHESVPGPPNERNLVEGGAYGRMTQALVEHLGDWVVGWWYTVAMEDYQDRRVIPLGGRNVLR